MHIHCVTSVSVRLTGTGPYDVIMSVSLLSYIRSFFFFLNFYDGTVTSEFQIICEKIYSTGKLSVGISGSVHNCAGFDFWGGFNIL